MYTTLLFIALFYGNRKNGYLMAKETNSQQQLFASTQNSYSWKSIEQIKRGEVIVVEQQDVKILGIRKDGDYWLVSYTDPIDDKKMEQLYNATDFVYMKA